MRKFIISDIHGFGNVYYSMINYIDNISKEDEVELYINGDLIDRGYESAEILLDIIKRIKENKYKIVYLGGNHELMMYKFYKKRKLGGLLSYFNNWYLNGGIITNDKLSKLLKYDDNKILDVLNFVSNLNIYHKFKEKINDKPIVLVHAACPRNVEDNCMLKIKDKDKFVQFCVWTRKGEYYDLFTKLFYKEAREVIGNAKYFTIIGHTPNNKAFGVEYHKDEDYLNIDGGIACYVFGLFDYNHFPLIEVCNNYLKILTFNSDNEIIYGNYFDGKKYIPFNETELWEARSYLNKDVKIKKISINENKKK